MKFKNGGALARYPSTAKNFNVAVLINRLSISLVLVTHFLGPYFHFCLELALEI